MGKRSRKRFRVVGNMPWSEFKKTAIYDIVATKHRCRKSYGKRISAPVMSSAVWEMLTKSEQREDYRRAHNASDTP